MILREYQGKDCKEVFNLFFNTVHSINKKDYQEDQLDVWANRNRDLDLFNQSLLENYTLLAIKDNIIVGFGDISSSGYLDRLFTHKDYQGQGVASSICSRLEDFSKVTQITTHASITAKPFFLKRGYLVLEENIVQINGIFLTNYLMEKTIS